MDPTAGSLPAGLGSDTAQADIPGGAYGRF
jgi:hypothetical protein